MSTPRNDDNMHSPQRVILDKVGIIRQLGLFYDLTASQKGLVAKVSEFYEYKREEIIYNEGDPPDAMYYIISGRVRIFTKDKYGQATTLEYLHRGSYFGIISLLTGEPHSVSSQVINDAVLLKILKEDFHRILRGIPKLAVHFSSTLSRRLKKKDMGQKTVFEGTIISVYGARLNIGHTLYAFNLARTLAGETKKDVLLLDMAHFKDAGVSKFLQLKGPLTPLELMPVFFDELKVKNSILRYEGGVSILRVLSGSWDQLRRTQIAPLLSYLTNLFDYCVCDLPHEIDETISDVLSQSDLVHIVTDNQKETIDFVNNFTGELEKVLREPQAKIKLIVNELRGKLENQKLLNYRVYATLPDLAKNEREYLLAIKRVAREIGGVLVGLALGSGAALGLAHIGVIKVLEREGIPIDVVAGSSIGALIGAFWAIGNKGGDIERIAIENKKRLGVFTLKDLTFPIRGLISDVKTLYFLITYLGNKTFQDVKFPLKIVAWRLEDRREVVIDSGPLLEAVRASIAIPGIYAPLKSGDRHLIDGGIVNPVPVSVLLRMKVKKVIAVNPLPSPEDIEEGLTMEAKRRQDQEARLENERPLKKFFFKMRAKYVKIFTPNILDTIVTSIQAMEYYIAEASCRQADVTIHPKVAGLSWRDFLNPERLISLGEEACEKALPEIRKLVEE